VKSTFSAADQNLGYLFQARMALLLALEGDEDAALMLEGLDDITFENAGNARALLQLKHHTTEASLTDSSPELWKTLRVWSTHYQTGLVRLPGTQFFLLTTAAAPEHSIAALLRVDNRDPELAAERLADTAHKSKNTDLSAAFSSFQALRVEDQKILTSAITVIDNHPDISECTTRIKELLRTSVRKEHRDLLFERLEGWWFGKVVEHLESKDGKPIYVFEVLQKIVEIADQFRPDALPIDFLTAVPATPPDPEGDNRQFVTQLHAISLTSKRIEKAILDYYRAFEQRSRWVRERLVVDDDLELYEAKLVDEWERYCLALSDTRDLSTTMEEDLQGIGREVYRWVEQTADFRIRPNVTEEYIMRGSYHMLADRRDPRIWWHPKFIDRLKVILKAIPDAPALDLEAN
jgi:hypothetical protein